MGRSAKSLLLALILVTGGSPQVRAATLDWFTQASATSGGFTESWAPAESAGAFATQDAELYYNRVTGEFVHTSPVFIPPDPAWVHLASGSSFADAQIGRAWLRAAAGTTFMNLEEGCCFVIQNTAEASLGETLFISVDGAGPDDVTAIGVSAHVHALMDGFPQTGFSSTVGGSFLLYTGTTASGFVDTSPVNVLYGFDASTYWDYSNGDNLVDEILSGIIYIQGAAAILPLYMQLDVRGQYGASDAGHTAFLTLDLPSGVTFTSASGKFLTDPPAVPLPAALPLFATGLAALGLLGRRGKGKAALAAA